nr:uncharacterized protein LOC109192828 [Ipomoea batatas]
MLLGILFSKQFRVDDKNGSWLGFREQGGEEEDWRALPAKKPNAQRQRLHSWALLSLFVTSSYDVKEAYKAISLASAETKGEQTLNLNRIWSYCKEIEKTNPKETCHVKLSNFMDENGARRLQVLSDYSLFVKGEGDSFMALLIYVDDVVIASPDLEQVQ